jgi:hypothetical protein
VTLGITLLYIKPKSRARNLFGVLKTGAQKRNKHERIN